MVRMAGWSAQRVEHREVALTGTQYTVSTPFFASAATRTAGAYCCPCLPCLPPHTVMGGEVCGLQVLVLRLMHGCLNQMRGFDQGLTRISSVIAHFIGR